jgi:hypothetical protein
VPPPACSGPPPAGWLGLGPRRLLADWVAAPAGEDVITSVKPARYVYSDCPRKGATCEDLFMSGISVAAPAGEDVSMSVKPALCAYSACPCEGAICESRFEKWDLGGGAYGRGRQHERQAGDVRLLRLPAQGSHWRVPVLKWVLHGGACGRGRPAARTSKFCEEIADGRLAMMTVIGRIFQGGLTGSAWGNQALYTAWPLLAFVNKLGVQAQVGLWDPARFAANGSHDQRGREGAAARAREEAEVQHPQAHEDARLWRR